MPVSTTLKLPEDLKQRIGPLAEFAGKTPHAWMIEALEAQALLAEKRKEFKIQIPPPQTQPSG